MTMQEFKAWFDGFTENIGEKQPSVKQWKRIKERVGEIDGVGVTERIYVDRWYTPYRQYWPSYWTNTTAGMMGSINDSLSGFGATAQQAASDTVYLSAFNGVGAMQAAGQAEAASMS